MANILPFLVIQVWRQFIALCIPRMTSGFWQINKSDLIYLKMYVFNLILHIFAWDLLFNWVGWFVNILKHVFPCIHNMPTLG